MGKITVSYPITVPDGKYCWSCAPSFNDVEICEHFNNEGGYPTCDLGFDLYDDKERYSNKGTLKAKECMELVKV